MGTDHTLSVVFRYTKLNCKKNLFLPEISLMASPIKPIATTVGIQSRNVTPLRAEGVIEIEKCSRKNTILCFFYRVTFLNILDILSFSNPDFI